MPRKKPTSTRQKKDQKKLARAVKRGDVPAPTSSSPNYNKKRTSTQKPSPAAESSRKLQSTFLNLTPKFLEDTKALASNTPLIRPIPTDAVILPEHWRTEDSQKNHLTCLRRPKWRFEQSKKEVEHNEEGVFKKWITQTDGIMEQWQDSVDPSLPGSPTYYERNLEVWRQLWRVVEISQIILVLLDSRCPLLHFPPSLADYLSGNKAVLVLTKTDVPHISQLEAWISYFRERYPNIPVVRVESYVPKDSHNRQGHTRYEPRIPQNFKQDLLNAIQDLYSELLEPPEKVKANPERLKQWTPPVPTSIDWGMALEAGAKSAVAKPRTAEDDSEGDIVDKPQFLTIGLIGQPNVGKSSLLNALFGTTKVRASKTPGKTKHFQTLFWTPDIRLVDCPGLVMPNFVPFEMQVLSGVLPIARMPAYAACIHFASNLLPLERVLDLVHPNETEEPIVDKRTWREGMVPAPKKTTTWTAMDILTAYANKKGWVTAKAGRPDVNRAANALLRALAEGQIPWAFWPPGTPPRSHLILKESGMGICLVQDLEDDDIGDRHDSDEEIIYGSEDEVSEDEDVDYDSDSDVETVFSGTSTRAGTSLGRFTLLQGSDEEEEITEETNEN